MAERVGHVADRDTGRQAQGRERVPEVMQPKAPDPGPADQRPPCRRDGLRVTEAADRVGEYQPVPILPGGAGGLAIPGLRLGLPAEGVPSEGRQGDRPVRPA